MASKVVVAHVNAYGSCQFFQNISGNTQRGAPISDHKVFLENFEIS
ncbi:hypothetical protein T11_11099 [Trichinella zimbabwensis]|uniref:Uncharacterized protein n=1 Tax=Trichinella zimbabwensis TaxID=268475 RepID=A0A0V1G9L1_9BILA|nr:hypothetical protein T11_11099 [Trichinella zimbabwensis]